jgi:DNA-binding transcriptional MerR regulator
MSQKVSIGEAARSSGVKAPTIRYYEQIGLFPAPPRTEGNRRTFDAADLRRLAFIRHARELGFNIDAVRPCWACRIGRTSLAPRQTKLPAPGWQTWSSASAA